VARAAAKRGVPVIAVAGRVLLAPGELASAGFSAAYSLAELEPDPATSIANAAELLERTGELIARGRLVSPLS
jgi:glycerate 2-kinase